VRRRIAPCAWLVVLVVLVTPSATPGAAATQPPPHEPLVVFLGDSLTAGLGLEEEQAWPAHVAAALAAEGRPIRMVNAGVSGDTTAGGLARLGWLLRQQPDVVVVELGANDGLRGAPIAEIESNLRQIVERIRSAGAKVLLCGMRIPTNYGPEYTAAFFAVYAKLAHELHVPEVPFLLEGVGGHPDLTQADGLHPTAAGHEIVAKTVLPYLREVLAGRDQAGEKKDQVREDR